MLLALLASVAAQARAATRTATALGDELAAAG